MQISLNKGFCSLTLDSAHEKFDVRTEPLYALSTINVGKFDSLSLSMCMNSWNTETCRQAAHKIDLSPIIIQTQNTSNIRSP